MTTSASGRPRRVRYSVAMSVDGFIAGSGGEYDWIPDEPTIDFGAFLSSIDTLLMGRKTYDLTVEQGTPGGGFEGMDVFVCSRTLDAEDHPEVSVVSEDPAVFVRRLKEQPGKDIWLFGGGVLFRSLLEGGEVDRIEVAIFPILLGEGIPLLPGVAGYARLELHSAETFPSGMVLAKYDVVKEERR